MADGPADRRLAALFDERVWQQAIRGFSGEAMRIATNARGLVAEDGVALAQLLPCEALGPDRSELTGCAKLYLPISDGPASERPFAFVFQLARDAERRLVLVFIAFGRRHPGVGVRNVYERAHRQLHGQFPASD